MLVVDGEYLRSRVVRLGGVVGRRPTSCRVVV